MPEAEVFVFPVSFAQQRLWFLQQLMPDNPFYNVPIAVKITGSLNLAALEQAFNAIVARHESLRTNFRAIDEPLQVIAPHLILPLPLVDLRGAGVPVPTEIDRTFQRPFDLATEPLLRLKLLQLDETEFVLLVTMHHIVTDGWSIGVLLRELATLYTAFADGQPSPLPELPIQYADFASWQRDWLQGEVLETQLRYWQQQLTGIEPLNLPIDYPRPALPSFRGAQESLLLSGELSGAIDRLSELAGTTIFMTLLAAFQVLLSRYTGQDDIAVGSPIANRNRREIEGLIGFFVNTLVLRTDLSGNPAFLELLARVKETALGAYAHQDLPFEKLVEVLQPDRDISHNPLFQVVFALQNAPIERLELPDLTLSPVPFAAQTARFDLEFQLVQCFNTTAIVATYSTDLFDRATIARMLGHFQTLLESIVANPHQPITTLSLLTDTDRQIFATVNDTAAPFPSGCVHHIFETQVEQTPDTIAAVFANQQLTYRELNDRANQLAHHLQSLGVEPEVLVAVCLGRSINMLVAILGILKAGGAYLPIDPSYPAARQQFMLADAQVSIQLTPGDLDGLGGYPQTNPTSAVEANHLAYVIYTSGSTGNPKGVLVEHRSLCNLAGAQRRTFGVQPSDRALQFASLSFDASIFEIIMAFGAGATLYLAEGAATSLTTLLQTQKITHATLPPVVLQLLSAAALPDLKTVVTAGEACSADLVDRWATVRFFNAYGLTETAVWATVAELGVAELKYKLPNRPHPGSLPEEEGTRLLAPFSPGRRVGDEGIHKPGASPSLGKARSETIGLPIANTQIYVLDCHLQLVPIGVPGELYIGGDGIARGYLHRPELTAERFIANPFGAGRLYKTGDRVRQQRDGSLIFLGRLDNQIKLRGYRIEPGEIEAVLCQHSAVNGAIVWVQNTQLVAAVAADPDLPDLSAFLRQRLPAYMVPAVIRMPTFPLTPNGKIDRAGVAEQYRQAVAAIVPSRPTASIAPQTPLEISLADLWAKTLGVKPGIDDNFFDLGGDSLSAMRLVAAVERAFNRSIPLSSFFLAPTIAQLAALLEEPIAQLAPIASNSLASPLVPLQPGGTNPPFFCVHPIFGTVFPYYPLARCLPDQPFYGLQPLGLDGNLPHTTIEAMAATYIRAMRGVQPEGPYYIGGWSFGGLVAFEMAQQLQKAGQQVAILAMFDTEAPTANSQPSWVDGVRFLFTIAARSILPLGGDYAALAVSAFTGALFQRFQLPHALPQPTRSKLLNELSIRSLLRVYNANVQAALSYVPQPYPETLTLFKTSNPIGSRSPTLGWNELVRGVDIYPVPGDHLTMLRKPFVQQLSTQLQTAMSKAQSPIERSPTDRSPKQVD